MKQHKDYSCPKCKGHLFVGHYVIFSTHNKRKEKGLILLSPDIGSYDYKHHPQYNFEIGEMVDFFCPLCKANLQSEKNNDFASVLMIDHQNMKYELLFSRKAGEQITYIISNDIIEAFGEHAVEGAEGII